MLQLAELNIPELNLTNPLYYGTLKYFLKHYEIDWDVYLSTKNMNLQRDFVWNIEQKRELIISAFKQRFGSHNGIKLIESFSAVLINDKEGNIQKFQIIDGKQRLSTLISFYNNEFDIIFNGNNYFYEDLSEELKSAIYRFSIEFVVKYHYEDEPVTYQDKIDWFRLINFSGTPQDTKHLDKLLK